MKPISFNGLLDFAAFFKLIRTRASLPLDAKAQGAGMFSRLNGRLHPQKQCFTVRQVIEHAPTQKSYVLTPDKRRGTDGCAPFLAGQFVDVHVTLAGRQLALPRALTCSPQSAARARYVISAVAGSEKDDLLLAHLQAGDRITCSAPQGTFYFDPLRDARNLVCIANGAGVLPFVSFANAIADRIFGANMTLIFCCDTAKDLVLVREFESLCSRSASLKAVYLLRKEKKLGYEFGRLTPALLQKYAEQPMSVFLSGSQALYDEARPVLAQLGLEECQAHFAPPVSHVF